MTTITRTTRHMLASATAFACAAFTIGACNDSPENESGTRVEPDASTPRLLEEDAGNNTASKTDSGFSLRTFTPPSPNPGDGAVLLTVSGEALALRGFAFPPQPEQEVTLVDGWSLTFDRLLVTVDAITLSENPDTDPNDPAAVGKVVAEATGPWAVDLAKDSPSNVGGKGSGRASPLAVLENQNKNGGAKFDTQGGRYALGYRTVAANQGAFNVNLDGASLADYESMVKEGCSLLYVGTATWKGDATCSPKPGENAALDSLPQQVSFRLCFKAPSEYLNCQNPDNDPAAPIGGEDHLRGVAFKDNTFVVGQATVHVDHPFWISVEEDSPAAFDSLAAAAVPVTPDAGVDAEAGAFGAAGAATLTMQDLSSVDYQSVKTRAGLALPWRNCVGADYTPPSGAVSYFSGSVQNVGPTGDPASGLRHLGDYLTYTTSTQGHLNADGLCYVRRNYVSPN